MSEATAEAGRTVSSFSHPPPPPPLHSFPCWSTFVRLSASCQGKDSTWWCTLNLTVSPTPGTPNVPSQGTVGNNLYPLDGYLVQCVRDWEVRQVRRINATHFPLFSLIIPVSVCEPLTLALPQLFIYMSCLLVGWIKLNIQGWSGTNCKPRCTIWHLAAQRQYTIMVVFEWSSEIKPSKIWRSSWKTVTSCLYFSVCNPQRFIVEAPHLAWDNRGIYKI